MWIHFQDKNLLSRCYSPKRHVLLGLIRNDSQKCSCTKISFPLPLLLDFSYSHWKLLTHLFQQSISPCPIQCPRNATQCGLVLLGRLTLILCTTHTWIPELVVSEAAPGSQLSDDFSGLLWSSLPLYHGLVPVKVGSISNNCHWLNKPLLNTNCVLARIVS